MSKTPKSDQPLPNDLRNQDLRGKDLSGMHLAYRQFQRADLTGASLRDANLSHAEFCDPDGDATNDLMTSAEGLTVESFAGADLTGATLPESLEKLPQVDLLADASKEGSKLLFINVLAAMFCLLSAAIVNDLAVLTNSAVTSALPGLGLTLPISPFIFTAPFFLLGLHLYFLLTLQHYEEIITSLPAVFPDGITLERKVYPWLFSSLATSFRDSFRGWRFLTYFDSIAAVFLAHLLIPLTIWIFWFRALASHSNSGETTLVALGSSIIASCSQFVTGRATLKWGTLRGWPKWKIFPVWMIIISLAIIACFWVGIYFTEQARYGAIQSHRPYSYFHSKNKNSPDPHESNEPKVPFWKDLLLGIGDMQVANISSADLTKKPTSWTGRISEDEQELRAVTSPELSGSNLRYIKAFRSFMVNAELEGADLTGAVLADSDLRGADLRGTRMVGVDLSGAKVSSNATPTQLAYSDLTNADLTNSDVSGASFNGATLQGARLSGSVLDGAKLSDSDLVWDQFVAVKSIDFETTFPFTVSETYCRNGEAIDLHVVSGDGKHALNFTIERPSDSRSERARANWKRIWNENKKKCPQIVVLGDSFSF